VDQWPVYNAALSSDAQSITGGAYSSENSGQPRVQVVRGGTTTNDRDGRVIKNMLFNLLPPIFIVVIVAFWMLAPQAWGKSAWSITVAGLVTTAIVLALEGVYERHVGWRLTRREFFTDLFYLALGYTVIGWASATLAEDPLKAVKHSLGITTEWAMHLPFVLQVALVIFLVEFGQYWMHRAMHNWNPLWLTHAPHHHITQLNAMKGAVGNPIELFLISLSVVALFDLPQAAEFCAFNILGAVSTFAHANVRSDPPRFYAFFFTTIRHHSLHHSTGYEETRCNYANSLILIDRVFGTYREGEAAVVGQDERRRLSIWEQVIFPAQPLIERFREKHRQSASTAR
jgi:sterol desaturase/sphingolipid hydroxylase (fatty acid hydroxylase superfamily)